ncbi:hypothetical protein NL676_029849 [Syzygium grande]|nr:hypothetical protein NL676_029849 [Syzygium grande]
MRSRRARGRRWGKPPEKRHCRLGRGTRSRRGRSGRGHRRKMELVLEAEELAEPVQAQGPEDELGDTRQYMKRELSSGSFQTS